MRETGANEEFLWMQDSAGLGASHFLATNSEEVLPCGDQVFTFGPMRIRAVILSACAVTALLAATLPAHCQQPTSPENVGLAVGKPAPDFKLKDHNGKEHSLTDLLTKGKVALVLFRSADW